MKAGEKVQKKEMSESAETLLAKATGHAVELHAIHKKIVEGHSITCGFFGNSAASAPMMDRRFAIMDGKLIYVGPMMPFPYTTRPAQADVCLKDLTFVSPPPVP